MIDGDLIWAYQTTVCRMMQSISRCIAHQKSCFLSFPHYFQYQSKVLSKSKEDFYNIAGFPSVVGTMDCTHNTSKTDKSFYSSALEGVYIKSCKPNLCRQKEFVYNLRLLH